MCNTYRDYLISTSVPVKYLTYKDTYSLVLDAPVMRNIVHTHQVLTATALLYIYLPLKFLREINWINMFDILKKKIIP